jgi:hypothetical protein
MTDSTPEWRDKLMLARERAEAIYMPANGTGEPIDTSSSTSPSHTYPSITPASASPSEPKDAGGSSTPKKAVDPHILIHNGIVPISSIDREPIDWAWRGRFAYGKYTSISGDPGDGKSLMMTALAAQITLGRALPYGSERVRDPAHVIFFSAEDDAGDTIRPRFEAAGGDPDLLHVQNLDHQLMLPVDMEALLAIIEKLKVKMAVIDPLFSYIGDLDPNAYSSAVAVCDPLNRMASATHSIIATIIHLNKASGQGARYRAGGSIGWLAKPRLSHTLGRDPNDRDVRVLSNLKINIGREPKSATFRIDGIGTGDDEIATVLWGAESSITADELLGTEGTGPKKAGKGETIATYFKDRLIQAGEEGVESEKLIADGIKLGISKSRGTCYRARDALVKSSGLVVFTNDPDDSRSPVRWRIEAEAGEP